jgi:CDP-diacylglycerol--serine O-phosphatidyltransferase
LTDSKPTKRLSVGERRRIVAERMAERFEDLSISKIVPSALTLLGLCSGATAIRFALYGEWKPAVIAIAFAMLFDMLDGRAARMLGADTRFGAQLDSLADLVSFGVAPALIVYTWSLERMGDAGWIVALIFCTCSAIRLARFNVQSVRDEGATEKKPYFTGLPTPASAGLMLLPLLVSFQLGAETLREPIFSGVMIAITSVLMVSRLPTPTLKYLRLTGSYRYVALVGLVALVACLVMWPWSTLTAGLVFYLISIPIGMLGAREHTKSSRA